MDLIIQMQIDDLSEKSVELNELADLLEKEIDVSVERSREQTAAGVKEPMLVTAIALIGLGLSAISTVISLLQFWQSQKSMYAVTVVKDNTTIQLDKIEPSDLNKVLAELEAKTTGSNIEIRIARRGE